MAFKSLSLFSSVAANQATWKGKPIGVSTSRQTLFGQIAHLPGAFATSFTVKVFFSCGPHLRLAYTELEAWACCLL